MRSANLRGVRFVREKYGYDAIEVEELLVRVADALDAGESPRTLIENCSFGIARWGCVTRDVDILLDEVLADVSESPSATGWVEQWAGI
jgi:hypothetical protein